MRTLDFQSSDFEWRESRPTDFHMHQLRDMLWDCLPGEKVAGSRRHSHQRKSAARPHAAQKSKLDISSGRYGVGVQNF